MGGDVVGRWRNWLLARGLSDQTVGQYAYHVGRLATWLAGRVELSAVGEDDLLAYVAGRRGKWAPATVKATVAALRSFYGWLSGEESPALAVPYPKVPHRRQRALAGPRLEVVLASLDTSGAKGRRDLALIYLMLDTGLRAGEVCRLRVSDVDIERRWLSVVIKGGDESGGQFGEVTANALLAWLSDRKRVARVECAALFVSVGGIRPGTGLTRHGLRVIMRRIGERVGVKLSPHDLRRGFTVGMLRQGASLEHVRRAGRWSNLEIVKTYADDLGAEDLARFSPVNGYFGRRD